MTSNYRDIFPLKISTSSTLPRKKYSHMFCALSITHVSPIANGQPSKHKSIKPQFLYNIDKLSGKFMIQLLGERQEGNSNDTTPVLVHSVNPYPTAFPYENGMVLHFYQQQESSTTKTVHKVINKGLKAYV